MAANHGIQLGLTQNFLRRARGGEVRFLSIRRRAEWFDAVRVRELGIEARANYFY